MFNSREEKKKERKEKRVFDTSAKKKLFNNK